MMVLKPSLSHSAKSMVSHHLRLHTRATARRFYADAVERAGTFDPAVIKALEDHEFSGMGNGDSIYRGADHQVFKNVLVVRGNQNPSSQFDLLER